MKNLLLIFFSTTVFLTAHSQYNKIVIQLKDKASSAFTLNKPSQYLSDRAIQRRLRYKISIDSLDLPVSLIYVDSIRSAGDVTILSTSKWLNQVLIKTTDNTALAKIRLFNFVKATKGVGLRTINVAGSNRFTDTLVSETPSVSDRISRTTGDAYSYGSSYNQVHIHEGEFLHNKGFKGEKMQIALLDAGFHQYKTITAFDSLRMNGQVLGERDFVSLDNSVNEDGVHGMYCLSILSANWPGRMVGTAPKANYWLIRTENDTTEYPVEEHNWVAGAEFADSVGSDMISTSLGYTTFDDTSLNHTYNDLYKNTATVSQAAAIAVRKGMIVTASAGNEGDNSWKYISFPADTDSVCTVGAVNGSGVIAGFSSYGYPGKVKPNIVSVGAGTVIAGLNNQPASGSGTSFSNPNVAGLIACLWQAFPEANNMKILDAVYKSADRYTRPDNRYGYGIPNFRLAYQLLKHDENVNLYGNDWLFATPNPFAGELNATFIGRIDGNATLSLTDAVGKVVATHSFTTEVEEVYNYTFSGLVNISAGFYFVKYSDSTVTKTIKVQKGDIFQRDWIVALPNPFQNGLSVYIQSPETAEVSLRLMDDKGSTVDIVTTQLTQNEATLVSFPNASNIAKGVYFLQYIGKTHKKTLRVLKQ